MLSTDHIKFSDGSTPVDITLGNTLNIVGTANEIEVSQNLGTFTVGLPNNVTTQNINIQSI